VVTIIKLKEGKYKKHLFLRHIYSNKICFWWKKYTFSASTHIFISLLYVWVLFVIFALFKFSFFVLKFRIMHANSFSYHFTRKNFSLKKPFHMPILMKTNCLYFLKKNRGLYDNSTFRMTN